MQHVLLVVVKKRQSFKIRENHARKWCHTLSQTKAHRIPYIHENEIVLAFALPTHVIFFVLQVFLCTSLRQRTGYVGRGLPRSLAQQDATKQLGGDFSEVKARSKMQMYKTHEVDDDRGRVGRVGAWHRSGAACREQQKLGPPDLALIEPPCVGAGSGLPGGVVGR